MSIKNTSLDYSGVLKDVHSPDLKSLRIVDVSTIVEAPFTRAEVDNLNNVTQVSFWRDEAYTIFTLKVYADINGQLSGKYIKLDTASESRQKVVLYYTVDGVGDDPNVEGYTSYEVPLNSNDTSTMVAFVTKYVLSTIHGLDVSYNKNTILIKNTSRGISTLDKGNTLFQVIIENEGQEVFLKSTSLPKIENLKYVYNAISKEFYLTPEGYNITASGEELTATKTENYTGLDIVVKDIDLEYNQFSPPKEADFVDIDKTLELIDTIYYKKGGILGEVLKIVRVTYTSVSKQEITRLEIL